MMRGRMRTHNTGSLKRTALGPIISITALCLCFALPTPAFAQKPGHKGSITKQQLVDALKADRSIDGRVIEGAHIAELIRDTDIDIKIRNSVIAGGLDLSEVAKVELNEELAPKLWDDKQKGLFIRARVPYLPKVRVITNKLVIRDSIVEAGVGKGGKASIEAEQAFFRKKVSFKGSYFKGKVGFPDATYIAMAVFEGATFDKRTNFSGGFFIDVANFANITMNREPYFSGIHFNDLASFKDATFQKRTGFSGTNFRGLADFSGATFVSNVGFLGSTFRGNALFSHVTFRQWAYLAGLTFTRDTNFSNTTFHKMVHFSGTRFHGRTDFTNTVFKGFTFFPGTRFTEALDLSATSFSNPPVLSGARFMSEQPPKLPASAVR